MKRTILVAAMALLTSSAALGQTEPPPPAPDVQPSPNIEIPPPPAAEPGFDAPMSTMDDEAAGDDAPSRRDEWHRGRRGGEARHHWRRGMGHHGPHHGAWRDFHGEESRGAVFRLNLGPGSPNIVIKCADQDTTLECANAVMPLLNRVVPTPVPGTGQ